MIRIDFRGVALDSVADSQPFLDAYSCFIRHGYAILDHVVPEQAIRALRDEFDRLHVDCVADSEGEDSLEVGKRRLMFALPLAGGFGDPLIFANPYVLPLVRRVLDEDAILEAFGVINSMDGATAQHIHRDGPPLFDSEISAILPAHALTCAIPLVDMDDRSGRTAIWPGSHRSKERDPSVEPIHPDVPIGSCVMWDFRTFHSGGANLSGHSRPMVYATYARRWYQDPVNFQKKDLHRLVFDEGFLRGLPAELRPLLSHVTPP